MRGQVRARSRTMPTYLPSESLIKCCFAALLLFGCGGAPRLITGGTPPSGEATTVKIVVADRGEQGLGQLVAHALLRAGFQPHLASDFAYASTDDSITGARHDTSSAAERSRLATRETLASVETDLVAVVRGKAWTRHVSSLSVDLVDASSGRLLFTAAIEDKGRTENGLAVRILTHALTGDASPPPRR